MNKALNEAQVTNGGKEVIEFSIPYIATVTIQGACDLLLHGWNNEAVEEKRNASKNSKAKKTDNVESYVVRNAQGEISIPGKYLRGSIINAAKSRQDPRSPRKSAMDLYKAGVIALTQLASLGKTKWDYDDMQPVQVQRSRITRTRPAFREGWQATFDFLIQTPEYISPNELRETIEQAGRLVGVGDFRPTYGRFGIVAFSVRAP